MPGRNTEAMLLIVSALESIMRTSGGVRVSAHVPGVSGNKQNAVVRLGMRADAVAPTWDAGSQFSGRTDQGS